MIYLLVIIIVLLCMSALASGSESAFFSLSPAEKEALRQDDSKSAKIALELLDDPKEILATLLIANNFVNIGIVIISTSLLNDFYPNTDTNPTLRFLIEVVGITLTILLFGEVVPKIYSTKNALFMARTMAQPINIMRQMPPISWLKWLLVSGTKIIQKRAKKHGINISTDELEQAIALTKEEHTSEKEHKILEGIIRFGSTECCQIMCSRLDVVALKDTSSFLEVLKVIKDNKYSRVPVYRDSIDNVIGILYIKDLLPHLEKSDDFEWDGLMHKPMFVPENKKIDDLLKDFQEKKMHMAIVVDEYGGASGIITLDDILEEIVGDITDEFDEAEIVYTKIDDNTYLFEGRTSLVDFYKVLDIDGKEFDALKGESETLGGFIVENAGKILRNNEFVTIGHIKLVVDSSDKRRIKMVKAIHSKEE
jgi:gliding motility-associated protein GldE